MAPLSKKYSKTFIKILIYITLTLLTLILVTSGILYVIYQDVGLENARENSSKDVARLSETIHYMNDLSVEFATSVFTSKEGETLMYGKQLEGSMALEKINAVSMLQDDVIANPMVYSIIVYNGWLDDFYSTVPWISVEDEDIKTLMRDASSAVLSPVSVRLPAEVYGTEEEVFSYFIYDTVSEIGRPAGAMVFYVKIDWLLNNLKEITGDAGRLYIMDRQGLLVAGNVSDQVLGEVVNRNYTQDILEGELTGDSFVHQMPEGRYVITYASIPETDWFLVKEETYASVFGSIARVRNITMAATAIVILLGTLIAVLIATRIYRPFANLIEQVRASMASGPEGNMDSDDAQYLAHAFSFSLNKMKEYEQYKASTRDIVKENLLKAMLLEWNSSVSALPEDFFEEYGDLNERRNTFNILLLKIDSYNEFLKGDMETRKHTRYVIVNTINIMMGDYCSYESFVTGSDEIVLIMDKYPLQNEVDRTKLKSRIAELQQRIIDLTGESVSVFISYSGDSDETLYETYVGLQKLSRYRLIHGHQSILDQTAVEKNETEARFNYPYQVEKHLLEEIKSGNGDEVRKQMKTFIQLISDTSVDNLLMAVTRMGLAINRSVNQMNINRMNAVNIPFNEFYNTLMTLDTIDLIEAKFLELADSIIEQIDVKTDDRHTALVESVKKYIEENYKDPGLNLRGTADQFKLSSVYLGAIFREYCDMSVQEYINEVRIGEVTRQLKETNHSVASIVESVGYENLSNFYKIFKKRFGVTPKQYRMK